MRRGGGSLQRTRGFLDFSGEKQKNTSFLVFGPVFWFLRVTSFLNSFLVLTKKPVFVCTLGQRTRGGWSVGTYPPPCVSNPEIKKKTRDIWKLEHLTTEGCCLFQGYSGANTPCSCSFQGYYLYSDPKMSNLVILEMG